MPHFQIVLDENVDRRVKPLLESWITVGQIGHELGRPGMQDNEIIPRLLLEVKRATLLTYDERIYKRQRPHAGYCLVILPELSAAEIAFLVRRLFQAAGFRTIKDRMGKVVHATLHNVRWKDLHKAKEQIQYWSHKRKRHAITRSSAPDERSGRRSFS